MKAFVTLLLITACTNTAEQKRIDEWNTYAKSTWVQGLMANAPEEVDTEITNEDLCKIFEGTFLECKEEEMQ